MPVASAAGVAMTAVGTRSPRRGKSPPQRRPESTPGPGGAPPGPAAEAHEQRAETGGDADVEARDCDQVRDAVDACDFPVRIVESARVADREGADERRVVRIGDASLDVVREPGAHAVDAGGDSDL